MAPVTIAGGGGVGVENVQKINTNESQQPNQIMILHGKSENTLIRGAAPTLLKSATISTNCQEEPKKIHSLFHNKHGNIQHATSKKSVTSPLNQNNLAPLHHMGSQNLIIDALADEGTTSDSLHGGRYQRVNSGNGAGDDVNSTLLSLADDQQNIDQFKSSGGVDGTIPLDATTPRQIFQNCSGDGQSLHAHQEKILSNDTNMTNCGSAANIGEPKTDCDHLQVLTNNGSCQPAHNETVFPEYEPKAFSLDVCNQVAQASSKGKQPCGRKVHSVATTAAVVVPAPPPARRSYTSTNLRPSSVTGSVQRISGSVYSSSGLAGIARGSVGDHSFTQFALIDDENISALQQLTKGGGALTLASQWKSQFDDSEDTTDNEWKQEAQVVDGFQKIELQNMAPAPEKIEFSTDSNFPPIRHGPCNFERRGFGGSG